MEKRYTITEKITLLQPDKNIPLSFKMLIPSRSSRFHLSPGVMCVMNSNKTLPRVHGGVVFNETLPKKAVYSTLFFYFLDLLLIFF